MLALQGLCATALLGMDLAAVGGLGGEREGEKGDGEQTAHAPGPADMAALGWHSDSPACCYVLRRSRAIGGCHVRSVNLDEKWQKRAIRLEFAENWRLSGQFCSQPNQLTLGNLALKAAGMGTTLLSW